MEDFGRWCFTEEALKKSPSFHRGVPYHKEIEHKIYCFRLINKVCKGLGLRTPCLCYAVTFLFRFYSVHSVNIFECHSVIGATIGMAMKMGGTIYTYDDIITEIKKSRRRSIKKESILEVEDVLVSTLGFDLEITFPVTYVIMLCNKTPSMKRISKTLYLMALDVTFMPDISMMYPSHILACFCIEIACEILNYDIPEKNNDPNWYDNIGKKVSLQMIKSITQKHKKLFDKTKVLSDFHQKSQRTSKFKPLTDLDDDAQYTKLFEDFYHVPMRSLDNKKTIKNTSSNEACCSKSIILIEPPKYIDKTDLRKDSSSKQLKSNEGSISKPKREVDLKKAGDKTKSNASTCRKSTRVVGLKSKSETTKTNDGTSSKPKRDADLNKETEKTTASSSRKSMRAVDSKIIKNIAKTTASSTSKPTRDAGVKKETEKAKTTASSISKPTRDAGVKKEPNKTKIKEGSSCKPKRDAVLNKETEKAKTTASSTSKPTRDAGVKNETNKTKIKEGSSSKPKRNAVVNKETEKAKTTASSTSKPTRDAGVKKETNKTKTNASFSRKSMSEVDFKINSTSSNTNDGSSSKSRREVGLKNETEKDKRNASSSSKSMREVEVKSKTDKTKIIESSSTKSMREVGLKRKHEIPKSNESSFRKSMSEVDFKINSKSSNTNDGSSSKSRREVGLKNETEKDKRNASSSSKSMREVEVKSKTDKTKIIESSSTKSMREVGLKRKHEISKSNDSSSSKSMSVVDLKKDCKKSKKNVVPSRKSMKVVDMQNKRRITKLEKDSFSKNSVTSKIDEQTYLKPMSAIDLAEQAEISKLDEHIFLIPMTTVDFDKQRKLSKLKKNTISKAMKPTESGDDTKLVKSKPTKTNDLVQQSEISKLEKDSFSKQMKPTDIIKSGEDTILERNCSSKPTKPIAFIKNKENTKSDEDCFKEPMQELGTSIVAEVRDAPLEPELGQETTSLQEAEMNFVSEVDQLQPRFYNLDDFDFISDYNVGCGECEIVGFVNENTLAEGSPFNLNTSVDPPQTSSSAMTTDDNDFDLPIDWTMLLNNDFPEIPSTTSFRDWYTYNYKNSDEAQVSSNVVSVNEAAPSDVSYTLVNADPPQTCNDAVKANENDSEQAIDWTKVFDDDFTGWTKLRDLEESAQAQVSSNVVSVNEAASPKVIYKVVNADSPQTCNDAVKANENDSEQAIDWIDVFDDDYTGWTKLRDLEESAQAQVSSNVVSVNEATSPKVIYKVVNADPPQTCNDAVKANENDSEQAIDWTKVFDDDFTGWTKLRDLEESAQAQVSSNVVSVNEAASPKVIYKVVNADSPQTCNDAVKANENDSEQAIDWIDVFDDDYTGWTKLRDLEESAQAQVSSNVVSENEAASPKVIYKVVNADPPQTCNDAVKANENDSVQAIDWTKVFDDDFTGWTKLRDLEESAQAQVSSNVVSVNEAASPKVIYKVVNADPPQTCNDAVKANENDSEQAIDWTKVFDDDFTGWTKLRDLEESAQAQVSSNVVSENEATSPKVIYKVVNFDEEHASSTVDTENEAAPQEIFYKLVNFDEEHASSTVDSDNEAAPQEIFYKIVNFDEEHASSTVDTKNEAAPQQIYYKLVNFDEEHASSTVDNENEAAPQQIFYKLVPVILPEVIDEKKEIDINFPGSLHHLHKRIKYSDNVEKKWPEFEGFSNEFDDEEFNMIDTVNKIISGLDAPECGIPSPDEGKFKEELESVTDRHVYRNKALHFCSQPDPKCDNIEEDLNSSEYSSEDESD